MRRNLEAVLAILVVLPLAGCSLFKKDKEPSAEYYPPTGQPQYPVTDNNIAIPVDDYGGGTSARYHTVGKKETLFSIARQYYNGDQSKWKAIYAANRSEIGEDPNRIRVGQRLVIP